MPHDKILNRRRLLRLVDLVDSESPRHPIAEDEAARLYDCGDALRDGVAEIARDPDKVSDEELGRVVLEDTEMTCPPYLASVSEGSGESTYRDNPAFVAGNAADLGASLGSSYEEGWACNWIVSLDSGQHMLWETRCRLLGPQYVCVSAETVAKGDWIVPDVDGKPGEEPRRVRALSRDQSHIHFTLRDSDPGATFAVGTPLWRRRRDGEEANLEHETDFEPGTEPDCTVGTIP